jgi:hypothetical protein
MQQLQISSVLSNGTYRFRAEMVTKSKFKNHYRANTKIVEILEGKI